MVYIVNVCEKILKYLNKFKNRCKKRAKRSKARAGNGPITRPICHLLRYASQTTYVVEPVVRHFLAQKTKGHKTGAQKRK